MKIVYDPTDPSDHLFCQWLARHEQAEPITFEHQSGTGIPDQRRIECLAALPEFRGWASLLASPGLGRFTRKVCNHLIAGRHTLPESLFGHTRGEIAEILKNIPPRPAAAIR